MTEALSKYGRPAGAFGEVVALAAPILSKEVSTRFAAVSHRDAVETVNLTKASSISDSKPSVNAEIM